MIPHFHFRCINYLQKRVYWLAFSHLLSIFAYLFNGFPYSRFIRLLRKYSLLTNWFFSSNRMDFVELVVAILPLDEYSLLNAEKKSFFGGSLDGANEWSPKQRNTLNRLRNSSVFLAITNAF